MGKQTFYQTSNNHILAFICYSIWKPGLTIETSFCTLIALTKLPLDAHKVFICCAGIASCYLLTAFLHKVLWLHKGNIQGFFSTSMRIYAVMGENIFFFYCNIFDHAESQLK